MKRNTQTRRLVVIRCRKVTRPFLVGNPATLTAVRTPPVLKTPTRQSKSDELPSRGLAKLPGNNLETCGVFQAGTKGRIHSYGRLDVLADRRRIIHLIPARG
jgi:hypothetical protein